MTAATRLEITAISRHEQASDRAWNEREFQRALNAVYRAIEDLGREAERSLAIIG